MKRYLGVAQTKLGLQGCLLEDTSDGFGEPRPLYLDLSAGSTDVEALLRTPAAVAWACPPPECCNGGRHPARDLHIPSAQLVELLRAADRLQGRGFRAAHLTAWLAWRESWGFFPQDDDRLAWDWLDHLARLRTTTSRR